MLPQTTIRTALFAVLLATIAAGADKAPPAYKKATITGWDTRIETYNSGNGQSTRRRVKVFELKDDKMIYQIDKCGAFQAGQFVAGQTVDYRLEGDRIYIHREDGKEYKCKMDGIRVAEDAKPQAPSTNP
jgi:hypothetical protein